MAIEDRTRWDTKHTKPSQGRPLPSVTGIPACTGDRVALDLACGQGRHSFELADRGFHVIACDISSAGLDRLGSHPRFSSARISRIQADLDSWPFRDNAFDLIVQCDFLDRRLFPAMMASVRPGGAILIDTFAKGPDPNAFGPSHDDYLLREGELAQIFASWNATVQESLDVPTCRATVWAERP